MGNLEDRDISNKIFGLNVYKKTPEAISKTIKDIKSIIEYTLDDLTVDNELNQPACMEFTMLIPNGFNIAQGDEIELFSSDYGYKDLSSTMTIFKGKIFSIKYMKDNKIKITAYDYLKYFASKHVMYIEPYKYSIFSLFYTLCQQLNLQDLVEPGIAMFAAQEEISRDLPPNWYLPASFEDDKTMLDILNSAINTIYKQTSRLYHYSFNDGMLSISDVSNNIVWESIVGDFKSVLGDFEYTSSIADNVYNRVIYYKDDYKTAGANFFKRQMDDKTEDTDKDGKIDHYNTIPDWGVLQYTEKIDDKVTNIDNEMRTFLRTHNKPKRTLELRELASSTMYRPGDWFNLKDVILGDLNLTGQALINRVKLKIKKTNTYLDLTLKGGQFD